MPSTTAVFSSWTIFLCVSISIRSNAEIIEAKEGTSVTLPCKAFGDKSQIKWLRADRNEIKTKRRSKYILDNQGNLKIANLTLTDEGPYKCSKGNDVFNDIDLVIQYLPVITNLTESFEIEENDTAVMTCLSDGYPIPRITWQISEENPDEPNVFVWSWLGNGSTINVTMPCSHCNVNVKCTAENSLGRESKSLKVAVLGKPKVSVANKVINRKLDEHMTLRCKINSLPLTFMNWRKNGIEVSKIPAIKKRMEIDFDVQSNSKYTFILRIKHLKKKDFGTYECIANNKYGNSSEEVTLRREKGRRKNPVPSPPGSRHRTTLSTNGYPNRKDETTERVRTVSPDITTLPTGLKYSVSNSNGRFSSLTTVALFTIISFLNQLNILFF
ncbi:opioid-binding cell adhesion molecule homolog isoform X1 [Octopus vulgaris]|uniref:Opioid-binding cell adhesion molecule homolog isoform X1 n=1 Tax=Octopus vulgaris TaxID=6645 RepID=A0AA36BD83_OCTVU|nr:opioid-binding cell adhesion molecule homolog isoform X1 [Octopus vulgaris]